MKARLNPAQIDLLIKRYLNGKTVYELGADFGISRQTVSVILKRQGVQLRMKGIDENRRGEVVRLRGQGWSFTRLGTRFDVNASTVRNFLT